MKTKTFFNINFVTYSPYNQLPPLMISFQIIPQIFTRLDNLSEYKMQSLNYELTEKWFLT